MKSPTSGAVASAPKRRVGVADRRRVPIYADRHVLSPAGRSRFCSDRGRTQRQTHMRTVPRHRALLAARARLPGTVRHLGRAHRHRTKSMERHSHCARAHPSSTETHHGATPAPVQKGKDLVAARNRLGRDAADDSASAAEVVAAQSDAAMGTDSAHRFIASRTGTQL